MLVIVKKYKIVRTVVEVREKIVRKQENSVRVSNVFLDIGFEVLDL